MHDIVFREIYIEGLTNNYYRSMSTTIYRRVVRITIYRSMSTNSYWRVVHKKNIFVLKTIFPYMANACVRESVRTRGMGYGM